MCTRMMRRRSRNMSSSFVMAGAVVVAEAEVWVFKTEGEAT